MLDAVILPSYFNLKIRHSISLHDLATSFARIPSPAFFTGRRKAHRQYIIPTFDTRVVAPDPPSPYLLTSESSPTLHSKT